MLPLFEEELDEDILELIDTNQNGDDFEEEEEPDAPPPSTPEPCDLVDKRAEIIPESPPMMKPPRTKQQNYSHG